MAGPSLEWTPSIALGIETIDSQHRALFEQINALMAALSAGRSRDEVGKAIDFLQDYVVDHFTQEAKYMAHHEYPNASAHNAEHSRFVADFRALKQTYEVEGATIRVAVEVQKRVGEWLITHIKRTDTDLAEFLKDKI